MAGNPKFDPFHWVKTEPKLEKSTDHDHNLISSGGAQDISACQIAGYPFHVFSRKCPEISLNVQQSHDWSDGPMDPHTGGKKVFQMDGGQPENQPPTPKGGGITKNILK